MKAILESVLCVLAITTTISVAQADANLPMPPRFHRPSESMQVRCIKTFTDAGYTVTGNDVINTCQQVSNENSLQAFQIVTGKGQSIDGLLMSSLLGVYTQLGVNCISAFADGGYTVSSDVVNNCSQVSNPWAGKAFKVITTAGQGLNGMSMSALTSINGLHSYSCVKTIVEAGYDIGSNSGIINACTNFNSFAADEALRSVTSAGQSLTETTVIQISEIQ